MEQITSNLTALIGFVGDVTGLFTSNPVLGLILAGSVASVALGIFGHAKSAAH